MILDDILSDYAASIATLALGLAGEPDEVVDRVTDILRANARDDISAHTIVDAFIAVAMKAKRAIELATPSTAGMTCH